MVQVFYLLFFSKIKMNNTFQYKSTRIHLNLKLRNSFGYNFGKLHWFCGRQKTDKTLTNRDTSRVRNCTTMRKKDNLQILYIDCRWRAHLLPSQSEICTSLSMIPWFLFTKTFLLNSETKKRFVCLCTNSYPAAFLSFIHSQNVHTVDRAAFR